MAIRLPLKVVGSFDDSTETGTNSVAGLVSHTFVLPQDTDEVVIKLNASVSGTGVSALLQTTDDGGTTWFDVARTSIISNGIDWLAAPVIGYGIRSSSIVATGSVIGGDTIGSATSNSTPQNSQTGMPILSQQGRVSLIINGNVTVAASNSITTDVKVNSQSATA